MDAYNGFMQSMPPGDVDTVLSLLLAKDLAALARPSRCSCGRPKLAGSEYLDMCASCFYGTEDDAGPSHQGHR